MATIYCFSATGNSLYAAKRIASAIGGTVKPMHEENTVCNDDLIGFVFPNHFLGFPRIVERFLSTINVSKKNAYIFAVITYGGIAWSVAAQTKQLLAKRNLPLRFCQELKSVRNYLPEYKHNDGETQRQQTETNLKSIIAKVKNKEKNRIAGIPPLIRLYHNFYPAADSDQYFTVSSQCTSCGTCQKVCPVNNITMAEGKPSFSHHCEHCLSCLHHCPAAAIDWKQKTVGKKRYRHFNITLKELISLGRP